MPMSDATDDFQLAYDRFGEPGSPPVLLLHGWPGDRTDMTAVAELLAENHDVVVPDLRGFGQSDKHDRDPAEYYSAAAQARSLVALLGELGLSSAIVAGYDVGSRVGQQVAMDRPGQLQALVVAPPAPGVGRRILGEGPTREFWYQVFHQHDLAEELIDGDIAATRAYLRHFWSHWSGPDFVLDDNRLDHLATVYSPPGSFVASVNWYRAGGGAVAWSLAEIAPAPADRIVVPTTFLWPQHDPLFPRDWSDRLSEFFIDVTVRPVDGVGHFVPVEAPETFAEAVRAAVAEAC